MYRIRKGEYELPPWFSPEAKKLISKLLVADPEKRITISAVTKIPWFIKEFSRSSSFSSIEKTTLIKNRKAKNQVWEIDHNQLHLFTMHLNSYQQCLQGSINQAFLKEFKVKMQGTSNGRKGKLSVMAEVIEVEPEVAIVQFSKSAGDTFLEYKGE
ncbi:hypothetical protein H5410_011504 [Solanum commersonii]|uniref:Uncharacterized protein n=1 Tax=Solanum commersonii TaxID=4109 RepID=A0A9J6ANV6_SOLCO|nr:hypothetical protein H5410_011504 [Solanum commersonii]